MKSVLAITGVTFLIVFSNCKKEKTAPSLSSLTEMNECHQSEGLDSIQTIDRLIDTWDWRQSFNPWTQQYDQTAYDGATLTISGDGTVVFTHDNMTSNGTWTLGQISQGVGTLAINTPDFGASGYLLLCKDEMVISASAFDGEDIWWTK